MSIVVLRYERSSIGRAPVSKTGGWGFDSLRSCCREAAWLGGRMRSRRESSEPIEIPVEVAGCRTQAAIIGQSWLRVIESQSSRSSKRDRCHGQSQRRSVGVETGQAGKGKAWRRSPRPLRPVPRQSGPGRSLQADAGMVRPGLHGRGTGFDPGRRGLEGLRRLDRVLAGLAVRLAGGVSAASWAGSSSGSFIFRRSPSS